MAIPMATAAVAQHRGRQVAQPMAALAALAVVTVLLSAVGTGAGCSKAQPVQGGSGGAIGGPDSGGTVSCLLDTICDSGGKAVRRCDNQQSGPIIQACTDPASVCSRGRCTTPDCAVAENTASVLGCLFYATDVANVTSELSQTTTILVTDPSRTVQADVALQLREAGQPWTTSQSITIASGTAGNFTLPNRQIDDAGKAAARAYRLVSDEPVVVVVIQSDDSTQTSSSSAGTMILPAQGLGQSYLATTFPQIDTPALDAVPGSRGGAGAITIVATQDGTTVTFTPSQTALAVDLGGGEVAGPNDPPISLSLDDGDVYQLFSDQERADLSGSLISADRPIAVFSGNISTTYGRSAPGINSPDLANEELLPVTEWATRYVAAWLPPQQGVCNSLLGGSNSGLWRIVASADGTLVTFDTPAPPAPPLTGLPAAGLMMNRGDVQELLVSGGGDFTVSANFPISVMQGMDCEPTLSSAVAADALISDLLFVLPPNFDHLLAIVRSTGAAVHLDDKLLDDSLFAPAGRSFQVARVEEPACNGTASCVHHLTGQFGVTLRGMDVFCSYALTAASWLRCIDTGSQCTN